MSHAEQSSFDPTGRECLSFTVSGDTAHFRRVDTTTSKETYRVIPRTTAAGLIAAIVGCPRDSYYESFQLDNSALAVEPLGELRTMPMKMTVRKTESFIDLHQTPSTVDTDISLPPIARIPDPGQPTQLNTFEYLMDASYRLHVVLEDAELQAALREHLENGTSVYQPSLGKSECLARLSDVSTATVGTGPDADEGLCSVASTAPADAVRPMPGTTQNIERTPASMATDDGGRYTNAWVSYVYDRHGGSVSGVDPSVVSTVDGTNVAFL